MALWLIVCPAKAKLTEDGCKALTLFHESRGESIEGARAVLTVVHNRMRIDGMTACEVMSAKGQFSWYSEHKRWQANKEALTLLDNARKMPSRLPRTVYYFKVGKGKVKWFGEYWGRIGRHVFFHKER